jgi:hypothetical protein
MLHKRRFSQLLNFERTWFIQYTGRDFTEIKKLIVDTVDCKKSLIGKPARLRNFICDGICNKIVLFYFLINRLNRKLELVHHRLKYSVLPLSHKFLFFRGHLQCLFIHDNYLIRIRGLKFTIKYSIRVE